MFVHELAKGQILTLAIMVPLLHMYYLNEQTFFGKFNIANRQELGVKLGISEL